MIFYTIYTLCWLIAIGTAMLLGCKEINEYQI